MRVAGLPRHFAGKFKRYLAATPQTSPVRLTFTLLGVCINLNFTLVTFLLADLQPDEWLSPHLFAANRSIDDPKGQRSP